MNVFSTLLLAAVLGTGSALAPQPTVGRTSAPAALVADVSPSPAASPAPAAATSPAPATVVDTKNFAYAPGDVTVPAGTTVRFTNSDAIAHTVTADDGSFDSKELVGAQSWSHVFEKAGTYKYYCAYHRYMHGSVVVK